MRNLKFGEILAIRDDNDNELFGLCMGQVGECNGYYLGITNQYKPIKYHPKESRELITPLMMYNREPLTFYYQLPFVVFDERKIIDEQSRGFIFPPLSRYFDDKIFEIMEAWGY